MFIIGMTKVNVGGQAPQPTLISQARIGHAKDLTTLFLNNKIYFLHSFCPKQESINKTLGKTISNQPYSSNFHGPPCFNREFVLQNGNEFLHLSQIPFYNLVDVL